MKMSLVLLALVLVAPFQVSAADSAFESQVIDGGSVIQASFARGATPLCDAQINAYLEKRLNTRATRILMLFGQGGEGASRSSSAWTKIPLCKGDVVFNLTNSANDQECAYRPLAGRVPDFISSVWGTGDCARFFKN